MATVIEGTTGSSVAGTANVVGNFSVNTTAFTVNAATGAVGFAGAVSGVTTLAVTTGAAVGGATPGTGGIAFPATAVAVADANTLDDYEEGTWTPTGSTSGGSANTYGTVTGTYTKIGRVVFLEFSIAITTNNGSGQFYVDGIPFSITDTKAAGCGIDSTSSGKMLRVNRNTDTRLVVLDYSAAYPAASGSTLIGSITYFI